MINCLGLNIYQITVKNQDFLVLLDGIGGKIGVPLSRIPGGSYYIEPDIYWHYRMEVLTTKQMDAIDMILRLKNKS